MEINFLSSWGYFMQSAILIANIGVRDLFKKEKSDLFVSGNSSHQKSVYSQSKELYESEEYQDLHLLLKPIIDQIIKNKFNLIEILLFGTKQEVENDQDTFYITQTVKKLIDKFYSFNEDKVKKDIVKTEFFTKNPTEHKDLMIFYRDKLKNITDKVDKIFVSLTGGTPQQNSAIMIESLSRFGEKSLMIYILEGEDAPVEYEIGNYVRTQLKNPSTEGFESESAVLIASLGVRDLGKKGTNKPLFDLSESNVFEKSEKILKNEEIEDLELILLNPAVNKVRDSVNLSKIILFGTKQDPPHQKDTFRNG